MPDRNSLSFTLDSSKDVELSSVVKTGAIVLDSVRVNTKNRDLIPSSHNNGNRVLVPTTAYSRSTSKVQTPIRVVTANELSIDQFNSPMNSKGKAMNSHLRRSGESSDYGRDSRLSFDAKPTFNH